MQGRQHLLKLSIKFAKVLYGIVCDIMNYSVKGVNSAMGLEFQVLRVTASPLIVQQLVNWRAKQLYILYKQETELFMSVLE